MLSPSIIGFRCYTLTMETLQTQNQPQTPVTPTETPPSPPIKKSNPFVYMLVIMVVVLMAAVGFLFIQNRQLQTIVSQPVQEEKKNAQFPMMSVTDTPILTAAPTMAEKTYTSKTEKVTFTYPATWIQAKPSMESNHPDADVFSIQDPGGIVKATWISAIDGFGGACDPETPVISDGCPLVTVIDSTPIPKAPGLRVVSAIISRDGTKYSPWMAVQDSRGLKETGRAMVYDLFQGKNNSSVMETNTTTTAIFSMKVLQPSDSTLSKSMATDFFSKPEVVQLKQILLSLSY